MAENAVNKLLTLDGLKHYDEKIKEYYPTQPGEGKNSVVIGGEDWLTLEVATVDTDEDIDIEDIISIDLPADPIKRENIVNSWRQVDDDGSQTASHSCYMIYNNRLYYGFTVRLHKISKNYLELGLGSVKFATMTSYPCNSAVNRIWGYIINNYTGEKTRLQGLYPILQTQGDNSLVNGAYNIAIGAGSIASGNDNIITAPGGVVLGQDSLITGCNGLSLGENNIVLADCGMTVGNGITNNGKQSFVLGKMGSSTGGEPVAHGIEGYNSLVGGEGCWANANNSLIFGSHNVLDNNANPCFLFGHHLSSTDMSGGMIVGQYNNSNSTDSIFTVAAGSEDEYFNAMEIDSAHTKIFNSLELVRENLIARISYEELLNSTGFYFDLRLLKRAKVRPLAAYGLQFDIETLPERETDGCHRFTGALTFIIPPATNRVIDNSITSYFIPGIAAHKTYEDQYDMRAMTAYPKNYRLEMDLNSDGIYSLRICFDDFEEQQQPVVVNINSQVSLYEIYNITEGEGNE